VFRSVNRADSRQGEALSENVLVLNNRERNFGPEQVAPQKWGFPTFSRKIR
jgi:hypothetical protein